MDWAVKKRWQQQEWQVMQYHRCRWGPRLQGCMSAHSNTRTVHCDQTSTDIGRLGGVRLQGGRFNVSLVL